jgi:F-type H+-transporting ATPase subunit gamma
MAEHMQDIKRRIRSIQSTERITNAMKLVSASKLRIAKATLLHSQYYLHRLIESAQEAFADASQVPQRYILGRREVKTTCFVVITSSSGLCGSFNGDVIRAAQEAVDHCEHHVKMLCLGSRGEEYFKRRGYEMLDSKLDVDAFADKVDYSAVHEIAQPLMREFHEGKIDEIVFVSTAYVNPLVQKTATQRILPIDVNKLKKKEDKEVKKSGFRHPVEYDPSPEAVFEYLVPEYVELQLYRAAIESVTCEHAARREAMENANDNASDLLDQLQTQYNRARQTQITNEIIEIVSGSEAMG